MILNAGCVKFKQKIVAVVLKHIHYKYRIKGVSLQPILYFHIYFKVYKKNLKRELKKGFHCESIVLLA